MTWVAIAVTAAGCYGLKLAGLTVPARWLERRPVRRLAELTPVALLAALVVVEGFGRGRGLAVDPRAAGVAVAAGAVLLRAPFLVVEVAAAVTAAVVRLLL
jgi:hypothetical protein